MEQCWLMLTLCVQTASCFHGNITCSSCRHFYLSVPGTQREFKNPISWSPAGFLPLWQKSCSRRKDPPLKEQRETSLRGFQPREGRRKGVERLHSSNNTYPQMTWLRGQAFLDREVREQIHLTLSEGLIVEFQQLPTSIMPLLLNSTFDKRDCWLWKNLVSSLKSTVDGKDQHQNEDWKTRSIFVVF